MSYNRQIDLPYPQPWEYVLDNILDRQEGLFFVDIGANDGLVVSNTAFMELNLSWNGICVEPHPEAYTRLDKNRNCKKYNCCVSNNDIELDFIAVSGYAEMLSGIKSEYDPKHLERINSEVAKHGGSINTVKIQSRRLDSILEENKITKIDYLSIDTEGSELSVLKSIDLDKYYVRVISAENNGYDNSVREYLTNKGYTFVAKVCADEIYTK
jgi:FkbM family methyltransferase